MQAVSQKWIDMQSETVTDEGFIEIEYDFVDPNIVDEVLHARYGVFDGGSVRKIHDTKKVIFENTVNEPKLTSKELAGWILDGTFSHANSENETYGAVGAPLLSEYGNVSVIQIYFVNDRPVSIPGITLTWSKALEEYAVDFSVRYRHEDDDGNLINSVHEIKGNTDVVSVVAIPCEKLDSIYVTVHKWCLPFKRPRLTNIKLGLVKTFTKKEIISFEAQSDMDILTEALPKSTVRFEIDNSEGLYDPLNTQGLSKYLMEKQEVKTRYGFKVDNDLVEWIDGGVYYLSSWRAPQKGLTATFEAKDLLSFLDKPYNKGFFTDKGVPYKTLSTEILTDAKLPKDGLGNNKYVIEDLFLQNEGDVTNLNSPLAPLSHREYLQLICNACNLPLWVNRKGKIVVNEYILLRQYQGSQLKTIQLNDFNTYSRGEIELKKPIKAVVITSKKQTLADVETVAYTGSIRLNGTTELNVKYSQSFAGQGRVLVTNGIVSKSYFYSGGCHLTVKGNGLCNITVYDKAVQEFDNVLEIDTGLREGEIINIQNPLLRPEDMRIYYNSIKKHLLKREFMTIDWRADPRVDVGDILEYKDDRWLLVTSQKIIYNGAFKGSLQGLLYNKGELVL